MVAAVGGWPGQRGLGRAEGEKVAVGRRARPRVAKPAVREGQAEGGGEKLRKGGIGMGG